MGPKMKAYERKHGDIYYTVKKNNPNNELIHC